MATDDDVLAPAAAVPVARVPLMTMMVCCLLSVVFAVGGAAGAMVWLMRSGKLGSSAAAPAAAAMVKKDAVVTTHPKALEPLLINLADEGGHAYLRLSVVLEEEDDPAAKAKEGKEEKPVAGADASVRDTIFDVLGRQSSSALLAPDGKEILKGQLKAAITARNPELHVMTIYFTDYLVQR
jgi:flagellar FliL protein